MQGRWQSEQNRPAPCQFRRYATNAPVANDGEQMAYPFWAPFD